MIMLMSDLNVRFYIYSYHVEIEYSPVSKNKKPETLFS